MGVTMKDVIEFLKSVLVGGFFVILPLAVVLVMLGQLVSLLGGILAPVAHLLPLGDMTAQAVAAVLIGAACVMLCFVAGVFVRTHWGASLLDWLERVLLEKLPFYSAIKSLGRHFTGESAADFVPAEVDLYGDGSAVMAMLVDRLPDGRLVVFVPAAPATTVGQLHLVPRERVRRLEVSLTDFAGCIGQWGVGAGRLYRAMKEAG